MTDNADRALRSIQEKLELLTGERANGSRRAVLIGEYYGAVQDFSDANVSMKKVVSTLEAKFNSNIASITDELLVRADENSALAQKITTLKAQVNDNIAQIQETRRALATKTIAMAEIITSLNATVGTTSAEISNHKKVYATDTAALASDLTRIETTAGKKRSFRQTTAPANTTGTGGNNLIVGDMWYDTAHANKPYYWDGSNWQDVSNAPDLTNYALTSSLSDEATTRASADAALAQRIITASAGTSRVYTQTTAPTSVGRQNGDVWIDTSIPSGQLFPSYKPYVWYGNQWNDNSSGAYTQYVGQIASISQTSSAAYIAAGNAADAASAAQETADASYNATGGAVSSVKNKVDNVLGVQWAVKGYLGGGVRNAIVLNGIQRADGSGAVYNLDLDTNVNIYGVLQTYSPGTSTVIFSTFPYSGFNSYIVKPLIDTATINSSNGPCITSATSAASVSGIDIRAYGTSTNGIYAQGSVTGVYGHGSYPGQDFYAGGTGTYKPFTGTHDALANISDVFEVGDIVVDVECLIHQHVSNTLCRVELCNAQNQKGVVGIVSSEPIFLADIKPPAAFNQPPQPYPEPEPGHCPDYSVPPPPADNEMTPVWNAMKNNYNYLSINAVGEGQINVCGENGDLEIGDLIVSSSIPGKGMKQDDDIIRSTTVAKVRENVTFASPTEVKMVACIYLCG